VADGSGPFSPLQLLPVHKAWLKVWAAGTGCAGHVNRRKLPKSMSPAATLCAPMPQKCPYDSWEYFDYVELKHNEHEDAVFS
jgi:hypothetical protein